MRVVIFFLFVYCSLAQFQKLPNLTPDSPLFQKIERVKELDHDNFLYNNAFKGYPIVFEGLIDKWDAYKKWDFDYFSSKFGNLVVPIFENPGTPNFTRKNQKLSSFIKKMKPGKILSHFQFANPMPTLLKDIGETPLYFIQNFFELYPENKILHTRFDLKYLFISSAESKIGIRRNLYSTHSWTTIIKGEQEWDLFSPEYSSYFKQNPLTPLTKFKRITVKTKPGDTLFIPSNWWFRVKTLKPSIFLEFDYMDGTNFHYCVEDILNDFKHFSPKYLARFRKALHTKEIEEILKFFGKVVEYSGYGQDEYINNFIKETPKEKKFEQKREL